MPNGNADDGDQQLDFAVQRFFFFRNTLLEEPLPKDERGLLLVAQQGSFTATKGSEHTEKHDKEDWFGLIATSSFLLSVLCKCYFQFHSYGEKHGVF